MLTLISFQSGWFLPERVAAAVLCAVSLSCSQARSDLHPQTSNTQEAPPEQDTSRDQTGAKSKIPTQRSQNRTTTSEEKQLAAIHEAAFTELTAELKAFPEFRESDADAVDRFSKRGDLRMFLGQFDHAVADYQSMVRLKPELDASHWRLGIALYYSKRPEDAAGQFDRYHSFDNVDRENGIWRYLSHRQAFGAERARQQLLKYEKDDRPPFREVYQLFDGGLTPEQVLESIPSELPDEARNSRLFYANLYIGLLHAAEGRNEQAECSLQTATLNPWPETAGFGPHYMWHVGRLQLQLLTREKAVP